jgi:hypothetical protein
MKITTFRKLALLPSSGDWRGRREEHLFCWAPQTELASITGALSENGSTASFRNVVLSIFNILNILLFGRWIKSINPSPHNAFVLFKILRHFSAASTLSVPPYTVCN